ncbi:hypothetical protein Cni_G24506 [Canna indica]|uniref:DUF679 domain membrane protein 2 n=1 Tax=Canna indica TaxID=4628 RepID=A0AAQ3KW96_9LILI|nr:hypothetical protein Cni_G24506 [Canna indica]
MALSSGPSISECTPVVEGEEEEKNDHIIRVDQNQKVMTSKIPPSTAYPSTIDRTLLTTANLVKLLPSFTVLAFQLLSPYFTNRGQCYTSNKRSVDGKLYYGIATTKGFYVFNCTGGDEEEKSKVLEELKRYRLRGLDLVHAFFALVVFVSVSFSDVGIQSCFFPGEEANMKQLLLNLPMGAGFIASLVFLVFPTTRKGIGYTE